MTFSQFSEIFALLAVQLRCTDAEDATVRAYHMALKDIEPEFVAMAAHRLARTAEWFPKTSEWREMAMTVAKDRRAELADRMRKLPAPLCAACDDTGWELAADGRAKRCACVRLRQLEILGRRPMPALTGQS